MIFNTNVETSPLRRRASRILAIAVPPRRKTRELVLTDRRLLCIKPKFGRHTVRYEFSLKPPQKEKYHLTGVEPKGDKEFVVLTVSFLLFIYSIVVVTSLIRNENSHRNRILSSLQVPLSLAHGSARSAKPSRTRVNARRQKLPTPNLNPLPRNVVVNGRDKSVYLVCLFSLFYYGFPCFFF